MYFFFKLPPRTSKMLKNPQVLEDRTLFGTPQCPSYLITIKKNVFLTIYIPMYSMSLFINTYVYYQRPKKHFFYSNEVGRVPDRVLSSSTYGKTASDFPLSFKIKWKTVRYLLKFCKKVMSCVCRINILPSPLKFSISIKKKMKNKIVRCHLTR
jgi:hypothetical protein